MSKILLAVIAIGMMPQITHAAQLQFCFDPYPPFTLGEDGAPNGGLNVELLDAVTDRIEELSATVTLLPWQRCQTVVRNGEMDGILPLYANDERAEYLAFTTGVFEMESVLWHRADQFAEGDVWNGNFEEISGLRLGMLNGGYIDGVMEAMFEDAHPITRARDVPTLMELLLVGRIDLVALDATVGRYVLAKHGWQEQVHSLARPISSNLLHFGLSKVSGAERYLEDFNRAIEAMHADGTISLIMGSEF